MLGVHVHSSLFPVFTFHPDMPQKTVQGAVDHHSAPYKMSSCPKQIAHVCPRLSVQSLFVCPDLALRKSMVSPCPTPLLSTKSRDSHV